MNWTTLRRGDKYDLVECVCECGVGHPAYGSALWIAEALHGPENTEEVEAELSSLLVHGCCGCCRKEDFPGTPIASLKYAHKLLREELSPKKETPPCDHDCQRKRKPPAAS